MQKQWFALLLGTLVSIPVFAADMQHFVADLSGELLVKADGTVESIKLNENLGEKINPVVQSAIQAWKFEPVVENGIPVKVRGFFKSNVSFLRNAETGKGRLLIEDTFFIDPPRSKYLDNSAKKSFAKIVRPRYPDSVAREDIGGKIMLLVEVDETGKVIRVGAKDVQLYSPRTRLKQSEIDNATKRLVSASVNAAKKWILAEAPKSKRAYVPVTYHVYGSGPWKQLVETPFVAEQWILDANAEKIEQRLASGDKPSATIRLKNEQPSKHIDI